MKITNDALKSLTPQARVPAAAASAREPGAEAVASEESGYTPSAEWLRLIDQVRQQPEVRADRVQEVLAKLQQGEYSAVASAEKTADAMLRAEC